MGALADLLGLPADRSDVLRALLTDAIAVGLKVTAWAKGSPTRAVYWGVSKALHGLSQQIGVIADQGSRKTAKGAALKVHASEVYGITVPEATFATTTLLISNPNGGEYPYSPNNPLILTSSVTKKIYVSQGTGVILGLTNNQPLPVQAQEAGSASTALPGQINQWVSSVDGLTILQPNPAIGQDAPSDTDVDAACGARVGFVPTASTIGAGGAPGAYESVARTGPDGGGGVPRPDGSRIAVTRVRVISDGAGGVQVVVADQDGPITTSDLALVDAAIKAYSTPSGTGGSAAVNAITAPILVGYIAYVPATSSATDAECEAAGTAAIVSHFATRRIGGYELAPGTFVFPLDGLRRAIGNAIARVAGAAVAIEMESPVVNFVVSDPRTVPVLQGTPAAGIIRVQADEEEGL